MFGRDRPDHKGAIRRVLIVEDDALIAFDNEHGLSEAGYIVVATIDTAGEAERWIAGGGIDLVLADVNLRGEGNGIDVARAAHAAAIPLLFVSGECPVGAQSFAAGCLAKPYTQRDLIASIEALEAKRAGRKGRRPPRALTLYND